MRVGFSFPTVLLSLCSAVSLFSAFEVSASVSVRAHVWLNCVRVLAKLFCGVNEFQWHYYIWRTCYERYAFFYRFLLLDKPLSQTFPDKCG